MRRVVVCFAVGAIVAGVAIADVHAGPRHRAVDSRYSSSSYYGNGYAPVANNGVSYGYGGQDVMRANGLLDSFDLIEKLIERIQSGGSNPPVTNPGSSDLNEQIKAINDRLTKLEMRIADNAAAIRTIGTAVKSRSTSAGDAADTIDDVENKSLRAIVEKLSQIEHYSRVTADPTYKDAHKKYMDAKKALEELEPDSKKKK